MLTDDDFQRAANVFGCPPRRVKAVCAVEAPRGGFDTTGQPTILFERHWFRKFTDGAFDNFPDISNVKPGGYTSSNKTEHDRLNKAVALNREAALKSASWGKFQIMGFNYKPAGFDSLQDFINAMYTDEAHQLDAFVDFVANDKRLAQAIKLGDSIGFARAYNGANYAVNKYDQKLVAAGF